MAAPSPTPRTVSYPHRVPVLSSRFTYADRPVLFGHAQLFGDRIELAGIELAGWRIAGRATRRIPLERLAHVDYHPLEAGSNLTLETVDGDRVELCVDDAHAWREAFERWLDYQILASAKLIPEADKAAALAG